MPEQCLVKELQQHLQTLPRLSTKEMQEALISVVLATASKPMETNIPSEESSTKTLSIMLLELLENINDTTHLRKEQS